MIDRNTYWLLDSVIRSPKPLQLIHPDCPELPDAINKPHHGMPYPTLVATLQTLFRVGYLVVCRCDLVPRSAKESDPRIGTPSLFTPTEAELHQALSGEICLQYAVTTAGGAAWEQVSAPQWHQFSTIMQGTDDGLIAGGNKPLIERLLWLYPRIHGAWCQLIPDSLRWTEERPWCPTYWKTVAEGYTVRFRTQPKPGDASNPIDFDTYDAYVREWEQITRWYTPYEA